MKLHFLLRKDTPAVNYFNFITGRLIIKGIKKLSKDNAVPLRGLESLLVSFLFIIKSYVSIFLTNAMQVYSLTNTMPVCSLKTLLHYIH